MRIPIEKKLLKMAKQYQIEIIDSIIAVRFRPTPDAMGLVDALDEVARIRPGKLRLWDFSCGADLAHKDIQRVANYANSIALPAGKVAVVAPQDLTYGIFRILAVYRGEKQAKVEVFRTGKAAICWLKNATPDKGFPTVC